MMGQVGRISRRIGRNNLVDSEPTWRMLADVVQSLGDVAPNRAGLDEIWASTGVDPTRAKVACMGLHCEKLRGPRSGTPLNRRAWYESDAMR